MDNEMLNRLAERSGARRVNSPTIPTIKLDGSGAGDTAGQFISWNGTSFDSLGSTLSVQMIKIRKKLWSQNDTEKYFSGEYDSHLDDVQLYKCVKVGEQWSEPSLVNGGTPKKLKELHAVKVVSVVYCVVNGALTKLTVKGASTTGDDGLYEYMDSFANLFIGQFQTEISVSKIQKNRAISYHRMHFKRGAEIKDGFDVVEDYLNLIGGSQPAKLAQEVQVAESSVEDLNEAF